MKKIITTPRRAPKAHKVDQMVDAVIEGVPLFKVNDELVLRRDHSDGTVSFCTVLKIYDDGIIVLWDETRENKFIFNVDNPPTLKFA